MCKISIIIPVYNCEYSIEDSIRSIQKQTVKELEIICINDGSVDCSAKVIQRLQEEDGRIILYDQDNQGPGAARNLGIFHATGEFISFLDADDYYLEEDALESMLLACKEHQVSVCGTEIMVSFRIKNCKRLLMQREKMMYYCIKIFNLTMDIVDLYLKGN